VFRAKNGLSSGRRRTCEACPKDEINTVSFFDFSTFLRYTVFGAVALATGRSSSLIFFEPKAFLYALRSRGHLSNRD
jgi:hypothetical protein